MGNRAEVTFDLYKTSGKWAYGGKASFEVPEGWVSDDQLLGLVAANQDQVRPAAITQGGYHVCVKETDECMADPNYKGFLCRLVRAK